MKEKNEIELFENKRIRTAWDEENEEWYFSIVDVVAVLTEQTDHQAARNYWKVTKKRLKDEGNETVTNCNRLKMIAPDGKRRLTDEISKAWSGMSTRQYKDFKGLKKENLRDNMTTLELVLNMLAEATTTEISKQKNPSNFEENVEVAREGGEVAGIARRAAEERTGVPVITEKNASQLSSIVTNIIEDTAAISDDKAGSTEA